MKHLDSTTLNLYLDDALDAHARAQADAHLLSCAACQRELAELQALTASFDAWRAEPIPHDISASVLTRIGSRPAPAWVSRWGAVVLGVQALIVALVLAWLLPMAVRMVSGLPFELVPTLDVGGAANFVASLSAMPLPFPAVAPWILIAALVGSGVVWVVGNRLLLQSVNYKQEASQ